MPTCPSCNGSVSEQAKFCEHCGTALGTTAPADQRKIVTVLFTDVADYTPLSEQLDPEALRSIMLRFFDVVRSAIERHGGTVGKYIGDAVLAVFGVPRVHEDDALRAVRAAVEIREALEELNDDLARERAVTLVTRTGIHTGEVMAGDPSSSESFVVGDTVNVAARLEQTAPPGEILIGATTRTLVGDDVDVDGLGSLDLKGKTGPVAAYRVVGVRSIAAGRERRLDAPLVGRERQLRALHDALDAAAASRAPSLFTVLGSAGVGKSRLVAEFLADVPDAAVHSGRCLSYGEGITYWPVGEIVRSIVGVPDVATGTEVVDGLSSALAGASEAEAITSRLAGLIDATADPVAREDGFWAVRRFFEQTAESGPLVLVFDDVQWAEPALLDLIEHIADWSRGAPIVLLCAARPELLDVRPGWGGGKPNATTTSLEALTAAESEVLIGNLLGGGLPGEITDRIVAAAEGNPLFVEEMLGMLIDDALLVQHNGGWEAVGDLADVAVPATVQSLISARIDRLDREDRMVIERGAVEGSLFHLGSVTALAPDLDDVPQRLLALVRKDFLRPDRAEFSGDDAFRFRHLLIRDAAYGALPMAMRAELHERFADWLIARAPAASGPLDAIVAHHLDEAQHHLAELGGQAARVAALSARAGSRYHAAGEAALSHGDGDGAQTLLERAMSLLPPGEGALDAGLALGRALLARSRYAEAHELLTLVERHALSIGRREQVLHAGVLLLEVADAVETEVEDGALIGRSQALAGALLDAGDEVGAARAVLATVNLRPRPEGLATVEDALGTALRHQDPILEMEAQEWLATQSFWADVPAGDVAERISGFLERSIPNRRVEATLWSVLGGALGLQGRFEEGRAALARARELLESIGDGPLRTGAFSGGLLEWFAGDLDAAEVWFRREYDHLDAVGEKNRLSSFAALLAFIAARRGSVAEAERMARIAEDAATPGDVDTHAGVAAARAVLALGRGETDEATRHATRGARMLEPRGGWAPAIWLEVAGEAHRAAGDVEGARRVLRDALGRYERKGIVPGVQRVTAALAELTAESR